MAVFVSFVRPAGIGSLNAPGIGRVRATEILSVPGTTSNTVQDGELVLIASTEGAFVRVAHGTVPDAAAATETNATSAGLPVPPQSSEIVVVPAVGAKINVKALA